MGLFNWLKPKTPTGGPTPEGVYGALPKGQNWSMGADPAGDPKGFVPNSEVSFIKSGAYPFDIVEWQWGECLEIVATTTSGGKLAGFKLLFMLSDGTKTDSREVWSGISPQKLVLKERSEWTIPRGHPTRELVLISQGEQTTQVLRKLEQCFGYQPRDHSALPDRNAIICQLVILRGIVNPEEDRFTVRMKAILPEQNGWPYCEFYLNVNSILKQIWMSEKSTEYRSAILNRISHFTGTT